MAGTASNGDVASIASEAYLESKPVKETRALVADLCRQFYTLGWVSGTGGSITIKVHDDSAPKSQQLIVMSPSGVQKERMVAEDMYVLSSSGTFLSAPSAKPYPHKAPKCTDCAPLFMKVRTFCSYAFFFFSEGDCAGHIAAYQMRNAGAVIHSHGMESCLITMVHPGAKEFRITHMEMIKGIQGHGYYDELVVPIVENTAHEGELTDSLSEAIAAYPKTTAVLVRNHGIYVWGDSWISAKTQSIIDQASDYSAIVVTCYVLHLGHASDSEGIQYYGGYRFSDFHIMKHVLDTSSNNAECYHYLFDAAIKLHQLGLDWSTPSHGPLQNVKCLWGNERYINGVASRQNTLQQSAQCILLDIEGTTTPISFVTDVLFPYARDNVRKHLTSTYDSKETQEDIKLLRAQNKFELILVEEDLKHGVACSVPIPPDDVGKEEVISSLVTNVELMIKADRKITALKQLQGHIWRTGYLSKELLGVVFEDVPEALERWHVLGIKVYIYSSGSREAQRLIFGNTAQGDLRKYLCGFFDTMIGNKRESHSYSEILQSVGVDNPSQVLFITDVYQEAVAAKTAGLEVIISIRPGNGPLPENHGFKTIKSFSEI
ncbi:hypothetical protein ACLOJK_010739 [Asimina triloba]